MEKDTDSSSPKKALETIKGVSEQKANKILLEGSTDSPVDSHAILMA